MTEACDLVVRGGVVLTMDDADRVLDPGAVAIRGDRIVAVDAPAAIAARYAPRATIDAAGHAIMPGLVDAYTHAGHGLIRGWFHPETGWPAHRLYWHATTPAWWRAEARLAAAERLRFGVTTALAVVGATPARCDDPAYALACAEGHASAGLRTLIAVGPPDPVFSHLPEPWSGSHFDGERWVERRFDHAAAMAACTEAVRGIRALRSAGRVAPALAPPYLLGRHVAHRRFAHRLPGPADAATIRAHAEEMHGFARAHDLLLQTHMFRGSVAYARAAFGESATAALLGPRVLAAHCNGLADDETALLGATRTGVAVVAFTHENLWYGDAPVVALLRAGARVAIATDGAAPYASLDLWRELARAAWNQWHGAAGQAALPPGKLLRMVTAEAAAALGLTDVGVLTPGWKADLVTVDLRRPHLTPSGPLLALLTRYAVGHDVADVVVDGRVLLREGRATSLPVDEIVATAAEEGARALERAGLPARETFDRTMWREATW